MPLPAAQTPWPPPALGPVFDRLESWSAWYSGDPDDLARVYDATTGNRYGPPSVRNRPAQYRGGVVGAVARWFWGAPTPPGQTRVKLHTPAAGDIAATSAGLLFSEPPTVKVDDTTTQDRLDELMDDRVHAQLVEAAEVSAALGGVYLRVVWDAEVYDRPWIAPVHADAAVPEWRWDRLAAVTFWRDIARDDRRVVRHLERHEPGVILHGVYDGTVENLGKPANLGGFPETAGLQSEVRTGLPAGKLTVGYVPNMRPSRVWRCFPQGAHLGRSDYSGVEGMLDALDETWTSWMRDIRLGKARLLVPEVYLQNRGRGQGAWFDAEQEIFTALSMLPDDSAKGSMLTPNQFTIRVEEHSRTARELMAAIIAGAGYDGQTFGLAGDTMATATEVTARERKSYVTRDRKIRYWRPELAEILETLLAIDAQVFGSGVTPARPDLDWPDAVSEDPKDQAQTVQLLRAAEAASTDTLVRLIHPDWDDTRVDEEVARIHEETGAGQVQNPDTFRPAGASGGTGGMGGTGMPPMPANVG